MEILQKKSSKIRKKCIGEGKSKKRRKARLDEFYKVNKSTDLLNRSQ